MSELPRYMNCPTCKNYHTTYPYCDTCKDGNRFEFKNIIMENYKFIFHCDRKACGDRCSYPTCRMTFDPNHAVNFVKREVEANTFYEEISSEELTTLYGGDINIGLNDDDIEKIRNGERIELYNIELDSRHHVDIVIKKE